MAQIGTSLPSQQSLRFPKNDRDPNAHPFAIKPPYTLFGSYTVYGAVAYM